MRLEHLTPKAVRQIQAAPYVDIDPITKRLYSPIVRAWDIAETAGLDAARRDLCRHDRFYLLVRLLHRPDAFRPWLYLRCREVEAATDGYLDLWAREHYKLQCLDEPTPTPTGWKLHGDLVPGDEIFGPDGAPCRVLALNAIVTDAECYEIEFDDGTKIRAGAEHLWPIERRTRRRVPGTFSVDGIGQREYRETVLMQTREIAAHGTITDRRLAIRVADPVVLPEADLPVAPYLLGAWLGDGTSVAGNITCGDPELFESIEQDGDEVGRNRTPLSNCRLSLITGLSKRLRGLGIFGKGNKAIPQQYLRGSVEQRLALLQGLMDTDGSCDKRGTATFVNTNTTLVDGFCELAHTLGLKPRRRRHLGTYKGEPHPYWQVSFQAYKAMPPFRIPRKLARCKDGARHKPRRYIVGCARIASVPMRCIQVDRPDGLYLTSRAFVATHNSTIITFAGTIQEILRDPEITIGIFSHTAPDAKKFVTQIKAELEGNQELKALFPDVFYTNPDYESPLWSVEKGITVKRLSNPREATVEGHGVVESQPVGAHYRLMIFDDLVTKNAVATAEQVKKTTEMHSLADNLGARGDNGLKRKWHIGTRYHFRDTYQDLMDRGALKPRVYPATDNGLRDGNPVFLTKEAWEITKRDQISSVLAAQMLQNPAAGNEKLFQNEWWRWSEIRPATLVVAILCDPASSKKRQSDSTVIQVWGMDVAWNRYLLDGYHHRMRLSERWTALRDLRRRWTSEPGIQLVKVGYERYGMTSDLEYFEDKMEQEKYHFPIEELNWPRDDDSRSKLDRIQRLEPDFRNGKILVPKLNIRNGVVLNELTASQQKLQSEGRAFQIFTPTKRIDENRAVYRLSQRLIEEFLVYPFAPHDDGLDCASRWYDMAMSPPVIINEQSLEPDVYVDGT